METEIKIKLSENEFDKIEFFMKNNAKFLNKSRQVDTYYQPTYRKFLKDGKEIINEWLRIGIRGNKKILNYKNWYNNMYCDEYEVEIDNENNLDKILKILGMEEIATVNKIRNTYFYLNKYEIALDYVSQIWCYVKIWSRYTYCSNWYMHESIYYCYQYSSGNYFRSTTNTWI